MKKQDIIDYLNELFEREIFEFKLPENQINFITTIEIKIKENPYIESFSRFSLKEDFYSDLEAYLRDMEIEGVSYNNTRTIFWFAAPSIK